MKAYIVEKEAILHNLSVLTKKAGDVPLWAVLKGNGYGLGLVPMAELCIEAGVHHFAVTELDEVEALRQLAPQAQILLLRPTTDENELSRLLAADGIATVGSVQDAAALNALAIQKDVIAPVHVKIDTGMGRYGFLPEELQDILSVYRRHDHLAVSGIYTHFPCAFCSGKATYRQYEAFRQTIVSIAEAGIEPGAAHCCNSNAFMRYSDLKMEGVRVGSALLGRVAAKKNLRRVGRCEATVEQVRWLPKGHATGYGSAWQAKRPTQIAVIPVGWYHGFSAQYGNDISRFRDCLRQVFSALKHMVFPKKLYVSINGKACPVLGHVGMLHTVCDVTKVTCQPGDTAILDINPLQLHGMEIKFQ